MSVGKNSLARAANAAAMRENVPSEEKFDVGNEIKIENAVDVAQESAKTKSKATESKSDKRFKSIHIGEDMPSFLL